MLEILCGRAGAGKTRLCLQQAAAELRRGGPDGPPLILLTPEQATHQLERALLELMGPGAAVVRLEVLSFQRLALRLLGAGGGTTRPRLRETGRRILIRALLATHRPELPVLGPGADRPGLVAAIASTFSEFWAWDVTAADLRARLPALAPPRRPQLADLARLWEAYQDAVAHGPADPNSELAAAARLVGTSALARADIWADGFAGFTPAEEHLLLALEAAGARVRVALCLDGDAPPPNDQPEDPAHPFAPTRQTLARLWRRRPGARLQRVGAPGASPPRFAPGGALARLEAGLWSEDGGAGSAPPGAVWLHIAADARAEAEAAADEMDRLCREEGFRHGEMAVVLRDLETYPDLVARACARRGIPVFVDRRRPVHRHPLFAALAAALDVLAGGWRLDAVLHYLRSGLSGLSDADSDRLENWALATGLDGPRWISRAVLGPAAGRRRANSLRARLTAPLEALGRDLDGAVSAAAVRTALAAWFQAVSAHAAVETWIREAQAAGRLEEAEWHRGCLRAAADLLAELPLALLDRGRDPRELADILEGASADLTVGLIPPGLDQVLCGAVERSRQPELRAVFVLGMREGGFPPPAAESPLLPDADRLALAAAGLELGPTSGERLLAERYLGYIALTRASERLYLSAPAGYGPAELFTAAARCLGQEPTPWPTPPQPTARQGPQALAGALAAELRAARDQGRPPDPGWAEAEAALAEQPDGPWLRTRALAGLHARAPAAIPPQLARALYPQVGSATRLEAVAACPFQHFAHHGLRLRPRALAEVRPSDLGQLLHAAVAAFVRDVLADKLDLAALDAPAWTARADAALDGAAGHVRGHLPPGSRRAGVLLAAARRDMRLLAETLVAHAQAGAYRPLAVERDFESGALRGRIDRIDAAPGPNGQRHLRVIDYKTGAAAFSLDAFAQGLNIQPVLYLFAALHATDHPGGFYLLPVRAQIESSPGPVAAPPPLPRLNGYTPAERALAALHEQDLDGRVTGVRWTSAGQPYQGTQVASAKDFATLREALQVVVGRLAGQAAAGDVAVAPYRRGTDTACQHCDLLAVCGFDPDAGDRWRHLAQLGRSEDAWAFLAREVDRGGGLDR